MLKDALKVEDHVNRHKIS